MPQGRLDGSVPQCCQLASPVHECVLSKGSALASIGDRVSPDLVDAGTTTKIDQFLDSGEHHDFATQVAELDEIARVKGHVAQFVRGLEQGGETAS